MWQLLLAFWLGVMCGVGLMAIVSINRGEREAEVPDDESRP